MLSYQHAYHAGSRIDLHKHEILARALTALCADPSPLTYIETHAGRGVYNLQSDETKKTGEANDGWLKIIDDKKELEKLSPAYVDTVKKLNNGRLLPRYPGSPLIAAHILRPQDKIKLFELHPTEYKALRENLSADKRMEIQKRDGLGGALELAGKGRGLVLIDPSYEVKTEYETIADFAVKLHAQWKEAAILIWIPMLPAMRHEAMVEKLKKDIPGIDISEVRWAEPGSVRGMYGSIIMGVNAKPAFQNAAVSFITTL